LFKQTEKPKDFFFRTGYEEKFMTMGLRAVDKVLAHMDNPDFDIAHYTILERLVHTLHMQEVLG